MEDQIKAAQLKEHENNARVQHYMDLQCPHHEEGNDVGNEVDSLPNWQWDELDPKMEFPMLMGAKAIQRGVRAVCGTVERNLPPSPWHRLAPTPWTHPISTSWPKAKRIVSELSLRKEVGDGITLYYKYMRFLEGLFFSVSLMAIPYLILIATGGDTSLAGATTVIFDVGLVMFSLGNTPLYNETYFEKQKLDEENPLASFKDYRPIMIGYYDSCISLFILVGSLRLYWLLKMSKAEYGQNAVHMRPESSIEIRHVNPDVTVDDLREFAEEFKHLGSVAPDGIVIHYKCRSLLTDLKFQGAKLASYDQVRLAIASLEQWLEKAMKEIQFTANSAQAAVMTLGGLNVEPKNSLAKTVCKETLARKVTQSGADRPHSLVPRTLEEAGRGR